MIIYHPLARREYDRQVALLMRNPFTTRVVSNFIEEIESAEKSILRDPQRFHVIRGKNQYRRFGPTKIYRFLIIYEIVGSDIYIYAIVHPSRRPSYWIRRRIS